jgi:hypothetical protein
MRSRLSLAWCKKLFHASLFGVTRPIRTRLAETPRPIVEPLEVRLLPSINLNLQEFHDPGRIPAGLRPSKLGILPLNNGFQFPIGYLPSDVQIGYGIDKIKFGSVIGDGSGQTIAIVDAYDDPAFLNSTAPGFANSDLAQFDLQSGISDPPSFLKVNEQGQTSPLPGTDPAGPGNLNGNWEIEEALDIEWAHGIAPGANIVFVEATTDSNSDLFTAVATAEALPGISAVSLSWGLDEYSGENAQDSTFVTPSGHPGVTVLAASGDAGGFSYDDQGNPTTTPGILYPAASPHVVAVGGTTLNLNDDDSFNSESAWSGSGGGTSIYESEPAYQVGAQHTGFRTIPDVAFDADPNTGAAVYDSYNDTDNSGPWIEVGGTSMAAPSWAGLIAIANQGRVLAGVSPLDGPTQTLPALYAIPRTDFNDITSGDNGVFSAGPGYDEVTGLGSPNAPGLIADLATYGTANHLGIAAQPPSSVIAGDSFGIVVEAENSAGGLDPAFNGALTIALGQNHPAVTLGGTLTATATNGVAVFDNLAINQLGTGYTIQVTSSVFPSITTAPFDVISNPTPWQGTFYPVPTDASLRTAISQADSNADAFNTILLSGSTYLLSDLASGGLVIDNTSSLPSKTLTITGQGPANTIIGSIFNWQDRIVEIEGSSGHALNVTLQGLTIEGGNARDGGVLGGIDALGGGVLIDGANVTLTNDIVQNNQAQGGLGVAGAAATLGKVGVAGGGAQNADGGGIYLASGTLSLVNDAFSRNAARGGVGGIGGMGGGQGTKSAAAVTGGLGGSGGNGGSAAGGGLYAAGGTVVLENDTFRSNQAVGGPGGTGGTGGSGGHGDAVVPGKPGGAGGAGGPGGAGSGGAIYVAGGSLTLTSVALQNNAAQGGAGGKGGLGGVGTALKGSLTGIFGGTGTTFNLGGSGGAVAAGGPGGSAGPGGNGGTGAGGGIFVAQGSLTLVNSTLAGNQAFGGAGGRGGPGGTGAFGAGTLTLGLPIGEKGGNGGTGGLGGSGHGGGIHVASGKVVLYGDTFNANLAQGGKGGAGGSGAYGPLALLGSGSIPIGTGLTGITGIGGGGGTGGGLNSAGAGGDGGTGGTGKGGGVYVTGGALTLANTTVAGNSVAVGGGGSAGPGGRAGTGSLTGGVGSAGNPGDSYGGGFYVNSGAVNLNNATIALNTESGTGSGGGVVVQSPGTVTAESAIFAGNGAIDYSGSITATDSLFQTAPVNGTVSGSGNLVGVNPLLASNGLQNNGGPTETIALQAQSPAIGKGTNPQNLFADQRGDSPRTGPGGTDIGAYQTTAQADTQAPTANLKATAVTGSNAFTLNPYTFTITYSDNVAVAVSTLSDAEVEVLPPGTAAPIPATLESVAAVGTADGIGNAKSFIVTYQITPPGGAWTSADVGTYTIVLGGGTVTDLANNLVATGTLGAFSVSLAAIKVGPTSLPAGTEEVAYNQTLNASGGTSPYKFSVTAGSLPAGLTLSTAGLLHGAPTASGSFTFTVTATDKNGNTGSQPYTLTINAVTFVVAGFSSPVTAGTSGTFTVKAEDGHGKVITGYIGIVHFTTSDPNSAVRLPANYTFTSSDKGIHTFHATLVTAGTQTLTATDTAAKSVTGVETGINVTPAAVTHFRVYGLPSPTIAGVTQAFIVQAKDIYGNVVTGYTGTVHFTTSDPNSAARLAVNHTFTSGDKGTHTFHATLVSVGTQSLTATDTVISTITGSQTGIVITAAALNHFRVYGFPNPTLAGVAHNVWVQAKDLYGNTITSYRGTVAFSSSDSLAVLPGPYTFTAADAGTHSFVVTLKTVGTQSISVKDTMSTTITGQQVVTVQAAAAPQTRQAIRPSSAVPTQHIPPLVALAGLGVLRAASVLPSADSLGQAVSSWLGQEGTPRIFAVRAGPTPPARPRPLSSVLVLDIGIRVALRSRRAILDVLFKDLGK